MQEKKVLNYAFVLSLTLFVRFGSNHGLELSSPGVNYLLYFWNITERIEIFTDRFIFIFSVSLILVPGRKRILFNLLYFFSSRFQLHGWPFMKRWQCPIYNVTLETFFSSVLFNSNNSYSFPADEMHKSFMYRIYNWK